jgi:hypothetical protein
MTERIARDSKLIEEQSRFVQDITKKRVGINTYRLNYRRQLRKSLHFLFKIAPKTLHGRQKVNCT